MISQQVDAIRLALVEGAVHRSAMEIDWDTLLEVGHCPDPGCDHREPEPAAASVSSSADASVALSPDAQESVTRMVRIIRSRHYSIRTEQAYRDWILRFLHFAGAEPEALGNTQAETFLSHLAIDQYVSVSTQRQALNALAFYFQHVLEHPLRVERFRAADTGP